MTQKFRRYNTKRDKMADVRARSEDELKPLKVLVKEGRLFVVQEWLKSGKPILSPLESRHRSIIEIAVNTGFHSMVEILAREWSDHETMNRALGRALATRNGKIAMLLRKDQG